MIEVNLVIGQNMVRVKGFNPKKVAVKAAECANEILKQISWLNSNNPSLQPKPNVSEEPKSTTTEPVPKGK